MLSRSLFIGLVLSQVLQLLSLIPPEDSHPGTAWDVPKLYYCINTSASGIGICHKGIVMKMIITVML